VRELNLSKLAAHCVGAHRSVLKPALCAMFIRLQATGQSLVLGAFQFLWSLLSRAAIRFTTRAWNRLLIMMRFRSIYRVDNLENMVEASSALTHYLRSHGYSFYQCIRSAPRGEG
jgi:hypothetical protein